MKLTILETTDIHGCILPINYANNQRKESGFCKISTVIKEEKNKNKNLILIDNGDILQGTPLTYYYANINREGVNPLIKVLNYLKYDGAVVGNHEFNYGKDVLFSAVKDSEFPWLSANILNESSDEPAFGRPYIVKEFSEGVRVGVLGITTKYIPNWENNYNIEGLKFEDVIPHVEKWIKHLKEKEKVDIIIVSYHGGFERNIDTGEITDTNLGENQGYELCQKFPEIDVLLTGHQHRFIEDKSINGVLTLQPGAQGQALGKVSLVLKRENGVWQVEEKNSKIIYTENVKEDKEIIELVKDNEAATQAWLDIPIGTIDGDMRINDPMDIRTKDNALIEFFNKVQMESSGADISSTSLFDNSASGFHEKVTMRDIVSNYIYPNTLKVIKVIGRDIKDALERSASYFEQYNGGDIKVSKKFTNFKVQHYNYDMWEGIEYKLNISKSIGHRVVELNYKGKPLDMNGEYEVVMNNYRAGGGGEYPMFKGKPVIKEINIDMAELIANYILKRKVVKATVNHNWEVIHD